MNESSGLIYSKTQIKQINDDQRIAYLIKIKKKKNKNQAKFIIIILKLIIINQKW